MTTEALFNQLKHPNPNLRDRAMIELVETQDEQTSPRLIEILDDPDTTYRRAAVKTLGAIGVDTVPFLVEVLGTSANVTVRASAVKALAQVIVNYPQVPFPAVGLACLQASMSDDNPVVSIAAVMGLGLMGASAFEILVAELNTTDNIALQVTLVNTLGSLGDRRAEAVLIAAKDDPNRDQYVRELATSALSRLDGTINYRQMKGAGGI